MVLRKADGQPKVVFWNNIDYSTPMEQEFQAMWHNLRPPPNQYQVRQELLSEGHQSKTEALGVVSKSSKKKEKKKPMFRRQKTTNIHLDYNIWDDVDLRKSTR